MLFIGLIRCRHWPYHTHFKLVIYLNKNVQIGSASSKPVNLIIMAAIRTPMDWTRSPRTKKYSYKEYESEC